VSLLFIKFAKIVIFQTNDQFVGVFSSVSFFIQILEAKIGKPPMLAEIVVNL
jgi:hypothetical protein